MILEEFERLTSGTRLMGKTKRALRRVMVYGSTWRDAARFADVYESTIMRAKNRVFGDRLVLDSVDLLSLDLVPNGMEFLTLRQYRKPKYEGEIGALVTRKGEKKATINTRIIIERNLNVQQDPRPLPPGHGGDGQPIAVPVSGQAKTRGRRVDKGKATNRGDRVETSN